MNYFQMRDLMPQIEKFSAFMDSHRILKPRVQTLFEAADKITPQFKAAVSPTEQVMRALMPRLPLAMGGRL
jgi:hypothetical protein